jgi:uncharacterized membrane protein YqaE (UPF0057 family)
MGSEGQNDFVRVILAYFLPPVGVFMQSGFGVPLIINIFLTFFFWVPGTLHAIWIISTTDADGRPDPDGMGKFVSLVISFFLPPVGVLMKKGLGGPFVINLLLTVFLFWLPGALHAAWVITNDD